MRALLLATLLAACRSTAKPTPPVPAPVRVAAPAPAPAQPVAPEPVPQADPVEEPERPTGAVPIPGTGPPFPLEQLDTTVTDTDLAAIKWPAPKQSRKTGETWIFLHSTEQDILELGVVENDLGVTTRYPLGKAKHVGDMDTVHGDIYPTRSYTGDYQGNILFAIRVAPPGAATLDQVVVFRDGTTVRAARRPLGATAWKPVVSVAFPNGTTLIGVGSIFQH